MATKANLMGLGVSYNQAAAQATEPSTAIGAGASIGDATAIGGQQYLITLTTVPASSGVKLPAVGGSNGCLLGDDFIINNQGANTIIIYAATNGSVSPTISFSGNNTAGTTGVSVSTHKSGTFYVLTTSSWMGLLSS